VRSDSRLP